MQDNRVLWKLSGWQREFAVQIGCGKSLVDHIHDLILAGINIDEFFRVISQQGVAQQENIVCVREMLTIIMIRNIII